MNNNEKEEAAMFFDDPQMLSLGLDEQEHKNYSHNKITYNKLMSKIQAKARQEAKLNYCYYCKKEVSSFCNSHSVPQFCLRRIAADGKVYNANTLIDLPFMRSEQGVNEAGTFQLICRACDSKIFQQYEDPTAYQAKPTGQMLAQIAMKDYLQMIYFVATCQKSSIATASHPFGNALNAAVAEFSLSKRNEIPNLLSEEFRLA